MSDSNSRAHAETEARVEAASKSWTRAPPEKRLNRFEKHLSFL